MPQDDIAAQWKSFDEAKRTRLLGKMTPEQKKSLRAALEGKTTTAATTPPPSDNKPATPGYFREALSGLGRAAGSILSIPKQLLTPHETFGATREEEVKMGPTGRLLYNIPADIAQSMENSEAARETVQRQGEGFAGQTLAYLENSMAGSIVKKAEEAGPGYAKLEPQTVGAVTEGVGVVEIPKLGGTALSKVGELRKTAAERVQPFARKVTGVEAAVKEEVTSAAEKHGTAVAENKAKRAETIKENIHKQREARTDIDREKIAVVEKNRGIEEANKAQADKVAKRGQLAKTVDEQSLALRDKLGNVEQSVAKEANAKFDAVREKIGNPETSADGVVAAVRGAERDILQGIPENIKEFKAILQHEGVPESLTQAIREHAGFEPEGAEPMTWDKLQSIKSRLDARLRSRNAMNGDVKRALYSVRDAVVDEMGTMAEANGATEEWGQARDFWRQYKEDFHEPSGPSGSGSPIAQSLNALDPKNIRQPFLSKQATTGNRAIDTLRKYPEHGGAEAATHAETLIKNHGEMMDLPDTERAKPLTKAPEVHELPKNKPLPPRPESPTVDINKTAREAIAARAKNWGSFNARDIGILASGYLGGFLEHLWKGGGVEFPVAVTTYEGGKYAASRALNNPKVVEWLAKTPPEEAAALAKIPGADKVKIVDGLTQVAVQSGKPVRLSPAARQLLGPANVARILSASGAVAGSQVRNRKEALERLGQPAQ